MRYDPETHYLVLALQALAHPPDLISSDNAEARTRRHPHRTEKRAVRLENVMHVREGKMGAVKEKTIELAKAYVVKLR